MSHRCLAYLGGGTRCMRAFDVILDTPLRPMIVAASIVEDAERVLDDLRDRGTKAINEFISRLKEE
jgi:hypothetical protein